MVSVRSDSWFELDRKIAGRMPALPGTFLKKRAVPFRELAAARVAQVGADAVAASLGGFGFLLFVFG